MISQEELKILKSFAQRIPPDDPGAHNNLAIVYYNKSLYDEAVEELEKALKIDPNFVLARNNLDIILKKTGRLEEKIERLARIIDREPYDENKTLELADTYRKLSRYSQAIIFYRKVIDFNPGSFEAHYGLGITLKLLGKYDDALEEVKKALEIKIAPEVYRTLGEIYFNKGVVDLAIKNFQESITLDPSSAEGHFLIGFALGEKGKIKESLDAVKKAIALNPALAQFEPNLPIDIREHKGHWEFLKEQLGMPKVSENEFKVHFNLGMTYRNKGLFSEAKREFEECRKISPDEPEVHFLLGEVFLFLYKISDALQLLQRAYDIDFDSPLNANGLGVAYILKGDFHQALDWFNKALAVDKGFVPALNNIGIAYANIDEMQQAVEYYKRAVEKGNSEARYNLGMYYLGQQNYDDALRYLTGNTADEQFGRGLVYIEMGKHENALECFKKTLSDAPHHPGAYYNTGFVLTKLGKFKEGLDYIRRGIEIEPNYEKNKHLLSLDPQLPGFGPYYTATLSKKLEQAEAAELPVLEIPDAKHSLESAEHYLKQNDFTNALVMVDQALSQEPSLGKAVAMKAKILYQTDKKDEALDVLRSHVKQYPDSDDVKATLGRVLKRTGNYEEAGEVYRELLSKNASNQEWRAEIAEIAYDMHDLDESLHHYEELYKTNREDMAANLGFLKVYIEKRELEKAQPYVEYLEENHPDVYDFNVYAGRYYEEQHNRDQAIHYFQKAIELDASIALPYYHLGLLQVQKGDFDLACDNWKKALLLSPEDALTEKIKHCMKMTIELSEFLKKET